MPRYSKTLTPQSQAAFLAALRGGALVVAAARQVGVAVSSLYCRRARDPAFAAAWEEAVEASATPLWRPLPGRRLRLIKRRRNRFAPWRRELCLAQLALTCDLGWAAEAAGVHASTVYRRIARDAGFARACADALARGFVRLERLAGMARAEERARLSADIVPAAAGAMPGFDEALRRMRRWERPGGGIGPRFVRRGRQKRWTFAQAIIALDGVLRGHGIPIVGEEGDKGAASG